MIAPVYLSSQPSTNSFPLLELKQEHDDDDHGRRQLVKIFALSSSPHHPHMAASDSSSHDHHLPCPTHHRLRDPAGGQFVSDDDDPPQVCLLDKVVMDQHLIVRAGSISSGDHRTTCYEEGQGGLSVFQMAGPDRNSDQEISSQGSDADNSPGPKWLPSKVRIIHKMKMRSDDRHYREARCSGVSNVSKNNSAVRVCSDCNTTTTPLWRSGPRGPKSLCNACGIRQRKARRATEAAAAAAAASGTGNGCQLHSHIKPENKKPRAGKSHGHNTHQSMRNNNTACKSSASPLIPRHSIGKNKQPYLFENFAIGLSGNSSSSGFGRAFPEDEAEAAALLLMELSRGLPHA